MTSADLEAEMEAASSRVRQEHLSRMLALGVPRASIATLGATQAPFGIASAQPDGSHLYQPGDGPTHVVMPVMEMGDIIDLIAWRSTNPAKWYWRTCAGWALGADWLNPRWDEDPVRLYATPLDWLAGAGQGICILDWAAPEVRELASLGAIESGEMIGRKLMAILSKPVRLPRMTYRKVVHHAAA
jgi:hypothetical protein